MRLRSTVTVLTAAMLLPVVALGYTGVFRSAFLSSSGSNPTGIAVGDFDRDGAVDAAVALSDSASIAVHVGLFSCAGGDRDGQFCFPPGDCPGGTCKPDGTLSQIDSVDVERSPSALVQAKFNGDDFDDLVVAQTNADAVVFLAGTGDDDFFDPPAPAVGVGRSPNDLAAADLDGDGELDVVVSNEGDEPAPGSITVLKGGGDGSFTLVQQPDPEEPGDVVDHLPTEPGTGAVAIGNIDADPAPDILALNARTISIFSGDGDGFFEPAGTLDLPMDAEGRDLVLQDVNGDSDLDLLLANFTEDTVLVRFGNGDGTFDDAVSYPVGTAPMRIVIGQMGGDARPDLVVSNMRSGDISVLLATGSAGTFGAARSFFADAEPLALGLGDFNMDGLLDAVAATQGSDVGASVAVLRNRGGGVLHAVEDVFRVNAPGDLAASDVDGDAAPDLVVSGGAGQVLIFGTLSNGFRAPEVLNVGGRTIGVAAHDLNGDAQPDIVASDIEGAKIAVLLAQGGGTFAAPAFYSTEPNPGAVTIGDFNADGRPDIAVATVRENGLCDGGPQDGEACVREDDCEPGGVCARPGITSVLLQETNGQFGPRRNTAVEETPIGIAAVDQNCDGRDDLVVANLASGTLSVLRSNPGNDGSFTTVQTLDDVGLSPIAVAVADFDRDGVDDVAVTNTVAPGSSANVRLFRGSCSGPLTAFGQGGQVRVGERPNAIVARDFTGDQLVDIAVTSETSNEVCLLVGEGDGTVNLVGQGSCDGVSRMPGAVAAADFDADGRYDAASANNAATSNNLSVLTNCIRDVGCNPFPPVPTPTFLPGTPIPTATSTFLSSLRGDGNGDRRRSAADLVAIATEVMDGDGFRVEAIGRGDFAASPGADGNGDGRVDAQDRLAAARRLFAGG